MNCGYCLHMHADIIELTPSTWTHPTLNVAHLLACPCCNAVYTRDGHHVTAPISHRRPTQ